MRSLFDKKQKRLVVESWLQFFQGYHVFIIVKNHEETKTSLDIAPRSIMTANYSIFIQNRSFGIKMTIYNIERFILHNDWFNIAKNWQISFQNTLKRNGSRNNLPHLDMIQMSVSSLRSELLANSKKNSEEIFDAIFDEKRLYSENNITGYHSKSLNLDFSIEKKRNSTSLLYSTINALRAFIDTNNKSLLWKYRLTKIDWIKNPL